MDNDYIELKEKLEQIKKMGWIEGNRSGDTGIGKLFEDLIGKEEDNKALPDYKKIEIKTKRSASKSMTTLYTKAPDYPSKVNTYLRENFGNVDNRHNGMKVLHTTINAVDFNTHISGYDFKIEIDKENKRLVIVVKNHSTDEIVYNGAYWSFENIASSLKNKLMYIAIISGDEKKENGKSYFRYTDITFITGLTFENFLKGIENGDIKVDIRIGVYNSGKSKGKTHDHGTGFRITLENLSKYATIV